MSVSQTEKLVGLEKFLGDHPQIILITPSSPDYASQREIFTSDNTDVPLAIVRPQTADDVSLLVKYATSQQIKFVVRSGGHNLSGLSQIEGALTIDMRDIAYVQLQEGHSSASIGGGILHGELVNQLSKVGLVTPMPTTPTVGVVGWAIYGGYGPLSANFGLGVDQILGAKIVNWKGEVIEADEKLLKGIRGAGGVFGIIVELTIKVYPLKTVFSGNIIYESHNISETFQKFNDEYRKLSAEGLPPQLTLQQIVVNTPMGRALVVLFMWSSEDVETGRIWLARVESFGTVLMNTVVVATIPDFMQAMAALNPIRAYGSTRTHNILEMSREVATILASSLEKMPSNPGAGLSIHELRGTSTNPNPESVFGMRSPHFMLEMLGMSTTTKEARGDAMKWATELWESINHLDSTILCPMVYLSLEPHGPLSTQGPLSKIFGSNDLEVLTLKQEYDPENIFELAVPRIKDYS